MCEFANPAFFLLLFGLPVVLWRWLRRPRPALRFPHTRELAELPAGRGGRSKWFGAALRGLALMLVIVALAGPRWPDRNTRIVTEGIAIEMLLDVSGSMAEMDFNWQGEAISRLDAVQRAFRLFVAGGEGPNGERLDGRPDDLLGLVAFASWPDSVCPLTLSHSVLLRLLDEQRPRSVPTESRTNIGDAIAWGLVRLQNAGPRRKVLVLFSDGEHNVPPPALKPRQAAQLAANQRVPIYVIDAGGDGAGEDGPADRSLARQTLQAVAEISGGRYFEARDTAGLLQVCREIDRMERQPISSFLYRRYHEGYPWFGLTALVLWMGLLGLEMTVWRRLP